MPYIEDCEITWHQEVAPDHYRIVLQTTDMARSAKAGQFCMLQVQDGLYPFLRRPMSLERIYPDAVSILYKIEGEGTRMLSRLPAGQKMSVQGPLGTAFPLEKGAKGHILVAGGIGIAPFPALAESIIRGLGQTPEIIIAARTENMLMCEKEFRQMGCKVHLATDDGSAGEKAFASQVLESLSPTPGTIVYSCGPMVMMGATHRVCEKLGLRCFASLEANMACGDGACLGCVVESTSEKESERMTRVCADGPVYDSTQINWAHI
jgi:dihydroorotate dehydrogenase electron transfer subunit